MPSQVSRSRATNIGMVSDWDIQAEDKARAMITTFRDFIEQHRDEIAALQVFYSRPSHARLKYEDIQQLADAIERARLGLTTDKLWQAYELLDNGRVQDGNDEKGKGKGNKRKKTQRMLTDLIALVRYTLIHDTDTTATLEPYSVMVQRRFTTGSPSKKRSKDAASQWNRDNGSTSSATPSSPPSPSKSPTSTAAPSSRKAASAKRTKYSAQNSTHY